MLILATFPYVRFYWSEGEPSKRIYISYQSGLHPQTLLSQDVTLLDISQLRQELFALLAPTGALIVTVV